MCDMIGAKLAAHERSRTDGSTTTGDDLRGLDVGSFITSAADVGASKDSVGPKIWKCSKSQFQAMSYYQSIYNAATMFVFPFSQTVELF